MYKVAVTGGRYFSDTGRVFSVLDRIHSQRRIDLLVHGNCPTGADDIAAQWAESNGVRHTGSKYSADWDGSDKKAGPIRNRRMLKEEMPNLLVKFPGGTGTADCAEAAKSLEIPIEKG